LGKEPSRKNDLPSDLPVSMLSTDAAQRNLSILTKGRQKNEAGSKLGEPFRRVQPSKKAIGALEVDGVRKESSFLNRF
jgi:hypothetical protein